MALLIQFFPEPDDKLAAIAVGTAKDPTMKVLLELKYFHECKLAKQKPQTATSPSAASLPKAIKAAFGEQVIDAESAINQLLNDPATSLDARYLAGALAVSEERWGDAVTHFETLLNLPMTWEDRRRIDCHLVALATLGLDEIDNEKNAQVVNSARAAALRLQRGNLSLDQLQELASVFEDFGLG